MPTQYDITDNVKDAVKSVLAAGQRYVATANIRTNRSEIEAVGPRIDVNVTGVSRASEQMAKVGTTYFFNHYEVGVDVSVVSDRNSSTNTIFVLPSAYNQSIDMTFTGVVWSQTSYIQFFFDSMFTNISVYDVDGVIYIDGPSSSTRGQVVSAVNLSGLITATTSTPLVVIGELGGDAALSGGAAYNTHASIVQRVRYLMSRDAQAFVSPVVTLFEVLDLAEAGESHEIRAETREDTSTLSYRMPIGLLPASYTVPTSGSLV